VTIEISTTDQNETNSTILADYSQNSTILNITLVINGTISNSTLMNSTIFNEMNGIVNSTALSQIANESNSTNTTNGHSNNNVTIAISTISQNETNTSTLASSIASTTVGQIIPSNVTTNHSSNSTTTKPIPTTLSICTIPPSNYSLNITRLNSTLAINGTLSNSSLINSTFCNQINGSISSTISSPVANSTNTTNSPLNNNNNTAQPQPPTPPPKQPNNLFANIDPRLAFVVSQINSTFTAQQVAFAASNKSVKQIQIYLYFFKFKN